MSTKRGGKRQRKDWGRGIREEARKLLPSISSTMQVLDAGKNFLIRDLIEEYNPNSDQIEQRFVRNESLSLKQGLDVFSPVPTHGVVLKNAQMSKSTGEMIEGSDIKILKMSDKTLLVRGNPFKEPVLKRRTSISKRVVTDSDASIVTEKDPFSTMTLDEINTIKKPRLNRTSAKKGTRLI